MMSFVILLLTSVVVESHNYETVEALIGEARGRFDDDHRAAALAQLTFAAQLRRNFSSTPGMDHDRWPAFKCPAAGSGVGNWTTEVEEHHHKRHSYWANEMDFCKGALGLWTNGCGVMCPLRAAVIGTTTGLSAGQLVLDIGSACGHFALWFHEWFGARTFGVDFVEAAVQYAQREVATKVPSQFCWLDVASGLQWMPSGIANLATAISVLHYLRTDMSRFETGDNIVGGRGARTPCRHLRRTVRTQCSVAREMLRAVKVGGHVWIAHNGSYRAKWDPRKVWGEDYWKCCFAPELEAGAVELKEVSELELFIQSPNWDPTYSVILKRLA